MVTHNAVATQSHLVANQTLCEDTFKGEEVSGLFEDHQFTVSSIDDMVNCIACTLSFASGHNAIFKAKTAICQE